VLQLTGVGGNGELFESWYGADILKQRVDTSPYQGFASRNSQLADAKPQKYFGHSADFF
jgi:hypothetical protein